MPNEILVVFYNSSNYDYHRIIKELLKEFEGKSQFPEESTEKYKSFPILIKKEVIKADKDSWESVVTTS